MSLGAQDLGRKASPLIIRRGLQRLNVMGKTENGRSSKASGAAGTAAAVATEKAAAGGGKGKGATAATAGGKRKASTAADTQEAAAAAAAEAAEAAEAAVDDEPTRHAPLLAAVQAAERLAALPGLDPVLPPADGAQHTSLLQNAPPVQLDSVDMLLAWQAWRQGPEGRAAAEQLAAQLPAATADFEGARRELVQAARRLEGLLTDHETFHRNNEEAQEALELVKVALAKRRAERQQQQQLQQQLQQQQQQQQQQLEAATGSAPLPP